MNFYSSLRVIIIWMERLRQSARSNREAGIMKEGLSRRRLIMSAVVLTGGADSAQAVPPSSLPPLLCGLFSVSVKPRGSPSNRRHVYRSVPFFRNGKISVVRARRQQWQADPFPRRRMEHMGTRSGRFVRAGYGERQSSLYGEVVAFCSHVLKTGKTS